MSTNLGPLVARRYEFPVKEAAHALILVGQGMSYTEAANRARVDRGRASREAVAQLVANWVETLGPVVCAPHRVTHWPETVVLDSTNFIVTNAHTGERSQAFAILGAWGYEAGETTGRALALWASPLARGANWLEFLARAEGEPRLVVSDGSTTIEGAVARAWPGAYHKLCEHHLYELAKGHLRTYGRSSFGSTEMALLNAAFQSVSDWRAFRRVVRELTTLDAWAGSLDSAVTDQARRRKSLPDHHSTGALDAALQRVRDIVKPRAFCYRNAERTNRMLELVRLRLNLADNAEHYARSIRQHLDAGGGRLVRQGAIRDRRGAPLLRSRV